MLADDAADRVRGRAMIEAALTDFRALKMVPHATLAEPFLRDSQQIYLSESSPGVGRRLAPRRT